MNVNQQKQARETEMNRRIELLIILLFVLDAGVVGGGVTSEKRCR